MPSLRKKVSQRYAIKKTRKMDSYSFCTLRSLLSQSPLIPGMVLEDCRDQWTLHMCVTWSDRGGLSLLGWGTDTEKQCDYGCGMLPGGHTQIALVDT